MTVHGNRKTSAPIGPTINGDGDGSVSLGTPSSTMKLAASGESNNKNIQQEMTKEAWIPLKLLPQKLAEIQQRNSLLVQFVQQQAHDISALAQEVGTAVPHMACLQQQWLATQQQKTATVKEATTQTVVDYATLPSNMNNNNNKDLADKTPKGTVMETPPRLGTKKAAKQKDPSDGEKHKNQNKKNNKSSTNDMPSNPSPASVAMFPLVKEFPPLVPDDTAMEKSSEKKTTIAMRSPGDTSSLKSKEEAYQRVLKFLLDMGYSQVDIEAALWDALLKGGSVVDQHDLLSNDDNGAFVDSIIAWIEKRQSSEKDLNLNSLSAPVLEEERKDGNAVETGVGNGGTANQKSSAVVGSDGTTNKKPSSNNNDSKPKNIKAKKPQAKIKATASPSQKSEIDEDEIERLSRETEERARKERQLERARQEEEEKRQKEEEVKAKKVRQEQAIGKLLDFLQVQQGSLHCQPKEFHQWLLEQNIESVDDLWGQFVKNQDGFFLQKAVDRGLWKQDQDAFLEALCLANGKVYRPPSVVDISGGESIQTEPVSSSNPPKPNAKGQQGVISGVGNTKESTLAPTSSTPSKTNAPRVDKAVSGSSSLRQATHAPVETSKLSQFLFPSSSSSSEKDSDSAVIFEKLQDPTQVELARKLIRLEDNVTSQKKEVSAKHKTKRVLEGKISKLEQEKQGLKEALVARLEALQRPLSLEENQLELEPRRYYESALARVQFLRAQPLAKWAVSLFEEQEKVAKEYLARYDEVESKRATTAELVKAARAESRLEQVKISFQIDKLQKEMTELEGFIEQVNEKLERLRTEISEGKGDGSFEDPHFDINKSRNTHGLTFLMVCTQNNDIETVQLCVELGAHLDAKCPRGLTALSYAKILKHNELSKFLEDHGGSDPFVSNNSWEHFESVAGGMSWDAQLQIAERAAVPADKAMTLQDTSKSLLEEESTNTSGIDQSCFDALLIEPSSCHFRRIMLMDSAVFEWTQAHQQERRFLVDLIQNLRLANPILYHRSFIVGVKKQFDVRVASLSQNASKVTGEDTVVFYSPFVESFVDGVTNVGVLLWAIAHEKQAAMYKHLIEGAEFRRHKVDNPDDHFPSHKAGALQLGKNMHLLDLKGTTIFSGKPMDLLKVNLDEYALDRLLCAGFAPDRRMLDQEIRMSNAIFNQDPVEHSSGLLSTALQAPDKSTNITGCAGTGKTLTMIKKLINEDSSKKVLFLSRLPRLVAFVKSEVEKEKDASFSSLRTYEDLLTEMVRSIEPSDPKTKQTFPAFSHVNFSGGNTMVSFEDSFVNQFLQAGERRRMKQSSLQAVSLWEAFRVIKSSAHCAKTKEPLTRKEYLKLPKSYGLSSTQRDLVYDLFQRYEKWLSSKTLWDEADRVLYIFRFGASVFTDVDFVSWWSRGETGGLFFYDMVCVDEAQDFSELDLSLFIRMAGSVRSLFIGADPAQSVEIGVRMRVGTVNACFSSALPHEGSIKVKDVLQDLSLKTNYRTHAGNVMLAKSIRKILTRSFGVPGSAENALFEGPVPKALRLGSIEELPAKFCAADTVFICCDEIVDEVRSTFSSLGVPNDVMGIRESKGLEYPSVACIGFFSFFENAGCSRQWENALRWLFSKKSITATDSTEKINGKVLENCDYAISHPEIEEQAMLFYTAVTRCKGHLYLVEAASGLGFKKGTTKGQSLADFAFRQLQDLKLVKLVPSINVSGPEMTPQQHKARGVLLVVQAISMSRTAKSNDAVRKKFEEAADRFSPDKGNDQHLLEQCMKHLEAIIMRRDLRQFVKDKFFHDGRYDLTECFADILQFEQDTMEFLELALNDSFLVDEVQDHRLLMEEVFYGSPYEAHFAEICDRLKEMGA